MNYAILKNASYILAHVPEMILNNGTTQTVERRVNPNSEYLKNIEASYRSFEDVLSYPPNQVYIGNMNPTELENLGDTWIDKRVSGEKNGKLGQIMGEREFLLFLKICDKFDLVMLEEGFLESAIEEYKNNFIFEESDLKELKGSTLSEIEAILNEHNEGLFHRGKLVGCVKKAHDIDVNLSAHTMLENLVTKASGVIAFRELIKKNSLDVSKVDYIIECSEEACGDMNQRGGGNFAKSIGEMVGAINATGSDLRSFCAAPVHALINAASLVKAGTYENVVIVAGGAVAKLGMNGKDHLKKGIPVLEDVLGGFAILISKDDGVSPIIRTDLVGKHTVGTGSSPQAVMKSLIIDPLEKAGLTVSDIDKYSVEMQNPDITKPAGAGDVPEGNYKMIGAIGVKRGDIEKSQLGDFIKNHGMKGWAPTQGHIPSGVPYCGFAIHDLTKGKLNRVMFVGKGSLFLGRMTNLFDGVSVILERNSEKKEDIKLDIEKKTNDFLEKNDKHSVFTVGVTLLGSELGIDHIVKAAEIAKKKLNIDILLIGPRVNTFLPLVEAKSEDNAREIFEDLLRKKVLDAVVTMHYSFPIGVSTIGKVLTPTGKEMFIASTTGAASANRVAGMVRNAIYGNIVAKSCGIEEPKIGVLNIEGAKEVDKTLKKVKEMGYDIKFGESQRKEGGVFLRGNDLIAGDCDVVVTDSLTGNVLMKLFSSFNSGGKEEVLGYGYGPGIGLSYENKILIVSRVSGTNVIVGAIEYAFDILRGKIDDVLKEEESALKRLNLLEMLNSNEKHESKTLEKSDIEIKKEVVTAQITGIDIMKLEEAVDFLKSNGIYSEAGMGCTGPIILVNESKEEQTIKILKMGDFID